LIRSRKVRVRVWAGTPDPPESVVGHDFVRLIPEKENPEADLGGKRRAVFRGYAGSSRLGSPLKAAQRMTLGLLGVGGASVPSSLVAPEKDDDTLRCGSLARRPSRSGRFLRGAQECVLRPEHLVIQIEVLGAAFGS